MPDPMHVIRSSTPLVWGELDLPILGITRDWHGRGVDPPAGWSLAMDSTHLWFIATHARGASLHPLARPGKFLEGLWEHDVAELFLADPDSGRYLELNLAPNASWWSREFRAPRVPATAEPEPFPEPFPGVETHAELAPDGGWVAAMALPLDELEKRVAFGPASTANVAFILESPRQRFLTAAELGGGEPDFHQPAAFPTLCFHDGGLPASAGAR